MTQQGGPPIPSYVRYAALAALIFLFATPLIAGRLTTYLLLLVALLVLITPSVLQSYRERSENPIDLLFFAGFALPSLAFVFAAETPSDLLFILNFAPFLLAIPFRWQLERFGRADGALIVARLSLIGAGVGLVVAVVQRFGLHYERVGQPLMSVFQYSDTVLLLGFMALAGLLAPGTHRRLPFLLGPVMGLAATVMSGTRGALLAAPLLLVIALVFGFARSRHRGRFLLIIAGVAVVVALLFLLALALGFDRAMDGFVVARNLLTGAAVDTSTLDRLVMLDGGMDAFRRSPIVGYGWDDMVHAILPYVPADQVARMAGFRQLHNGLMSFAVGAGSLGVLAFVILSVAPIVAVFYSPRDDQFAARLYLAVTLCAGYAVFQLTIIMIGFEFHTVQYAFMTMALVAFIGAPVRAATQVHSVRGNASVGPETAKTA